MLLVEDVPLLRELHRDLFKIHGFRCRTAGSEYEAQRIIEYGYFPEVAVVDYLIPPGKDASLDAESYGLTGGLRLCQTILRLTDNRCRIVLLSALNKYREAAQAGGIWGFYEKPISHDHYDRFFSLLRQGVLHDDEIGRPTINMKAEFSLHGYGKEKF
jgi:CheY-like chemotaxis protein